MGQRDLRQLLVLGATAVIRHAGRRKEITDPWLRRMLAEKPAKLVAVALANKMARIIWALMVTGESYRAPKCSVRSRDRAGLGRKLRTRGIAARAGDGPNRVRAGRRKK